ncbi:MAG: hypothetical protein M0T77_06805 [Actinomycetota bacterium]|nr:hypothetical protein [Actinomycetota bacterium]
MSPGRSPNSTEPRWWEFRSARNRKPSTYSCPLCGELLPSLSDHFLLFPEGDHNRRRHAHTACVLAAREQGRLPTREEWERAQQGWQPRRRWWRLGRPG